MPESVEHRPVHASLYECPTGESEGCGEPSCIPDGTGEPALHVSFATSWTSSPAHLRYKMSDRGFKAMPSIRGPRGFVEVTESSLAEGPHLWVEAEGQLTLDEATHLRDQLDFLIEHHYQQEGKS